MGRTIVATDSGACMPLPREVTPRVSQKWALTGAEQGDWPIA